MVSQENSGKEFVSGRDGSGLSPGNPVGSAASGLPGFYLPPMVGMGGNGPQAGFATGATRSTDVDKVDIEGHIHPEVLAIFGEYMHRHRIQRDGKVRTSDNWQEGIPVYRYVKSLVRHGLEFWRMWRGSPVVNPDSGAFFTIGDVLCAILFNTMGILYELGVRGNISYLLSKTYITKDMRKAFEDGPDMRAYSLPPQSSPQGETDRRYKGTLITPYSQGGIARGSIIFEGTFADLNRVGTNEIEFNCRPTDYITVIRG